VGLKKVTFLGIIYRYEQVYGHPVQVHHSIIIGSKHHLYFDMEGGVFGFLYILRLVYLSSGV
jgi:hypothetical protein